MMGRHLLTYMVPNLAQAVASFGTVAILTQFLSAADYGRYALVYTAMTLAQYVTVTWIEACAARFYGQAAEREQKPAHFATLLNALLWCSILFGALSVAAIAIWPGDNGLKIVLAAAFSGVLMRSFVKIALETRRMAQEANRFAAVDTLHTLLAFALSAILVVYFSTGPEGAFLGMTIAAIIVMLIEGPALFLAAKHGTVETDRMKEYFAYGAPLAGGLVLSLVLTSGDRFVINGFLGEAQVGAYSAGYQVAARILDIIFAWGAAAVTPILIAAYERGGPEEAAQVAKGGFAFRLGIGAPAALGIALLAHPICNILIGENLRNEAAMIVPGIAVAALMAGMCDYFSEAFMLAKKAFQRALLLLVPAVLNIAANFVLLPRVGLMGAVYATVLAYGVGMMLLALVGRRYVKLPVPALEIGKIAFACACMAAIVLISPDPSLGLGPVFMNRLGESGIEPVRILGIIDTIYNAALGAVTYGCVAVLLDVANARSRLNSIFVRVPKSGAVS
jgi:O-antigen/teichoic acid export membrane protein